jgi:hypothetical protein
MQRTKNSLSLLLTHKQPTTPLRLSLALFPCGQLRVGDCEARANRQRGKLIDRPSKRRLRSFSQSIAISRPRRASSASCAIGHLPEREIMTGIGPVAVRQPRVRDRDATEGERIRYSPSILPRYARRSQSLEVLIPILYLKGISTGDFEEALAALVSKGAPGLSASTIARLKEVWTEEHARWQKRDLFGTQRPQCQ